MSKAASIGLPDLIRGLETVYLLIWLGLGILAVWLPKNWKLKVGAFVLVLIAGSVLPVYLSWQVKQEVAKQKPIIEKRNAQLEAAMVRFEERCKTAGEKIYRTVENVDGIFLANVRPKSSAADWDDPNWPDAALPDEGNEDWYIRKFLFWEQRDVGEQSRGYLNEKPSPLNGYKFVDVAQSDGSFVRYRIQKVGEAALNKDIGSGAPARYAVSFVNMVDPADRKLWVAGTKVTIKDTKNNEIIAESTWYAIDLEQGSTVGFKSAWKLSKTCPSTAGWIGRAPTRFFVDRVLKPSLEKIK